MQQKAQTDLWKMSQIREVIFHYKRGDYGDDEIIAARAALIDIIKMAKEDD